MIFTQVINNMLNEINIYDYDLIVFDIDGTVHDSDHNLHPFTQQTLLKLHEYSFPFTLATGKNLPATKKTADALDIRLPLILSNGCMLQKRTGEILHKSTLPINVTMTVIQICERMDLDLALYLDDDIYIRKMNHNYEILLEYGSPELIPVAEWAELDGKLAIIHKLMVIDRISRENLLSLEQVYRENIREKVEYCYTLDEMLEVMPAGVSKKSALQYLLDQESITFENVMAFGDGDNDVEMISEAGLGIAVENGSEKVKEAADLIIPSCDENGPAKFLDQLIKLKE